MSLPYRLPLALALVAVTDSAPVQSVPTRTLGKPDAEFAEPFSYLSMIRELKDGRVIAIDPRDKALVVIDLARGTSSRIGREGSGPGEYAIPFRLLALPGDTTAMSDMINNRMLVINPNATAGGFIDPTLPPPSGTVTFGSTATMPTEADTKGRLYYQGMRYRRTETGPKYVDSVPMIRWDRATGKRDSVAWMPIKNATLVASSANGRTVYSIPPFTGFNQMLAAPDGRIAIVYHDPYRVDFVSEDGRRTTGQPIAYERLRISEGHKAEWREQQRGRTNVLTLNGSTTTESAGLQPDPAEWGGEYMPPFLERALMFSNDGFLWIRRTGPAGQPPTYDLIDRAGNLAQKVVMSKGTHLVGFGNGAIYTARVDQDGLQYLQKFKLVSP